MPINQSYRGDHVDTLLSNFSVALWQDTDVFVGTRFFGVQNVAKASDLYDYYPQGVFNRAVKSARAEEGVANTVGYKKQTKAYSCGDDALRIFISDRKRANADNVDDLNMASTEAVVSALLLSKELTFKDNFLTAGKWGKDYTGGVDFPVSGTKKWSDPTSDPIGDIIKERTDFVKRSGGRLPNKALMTLDVFDVVREHPNVLDRVSGGATTAMPAKVMRQKLAELLEVDELVVMQSIINNANDEVVDVDGNPVADNQFIAEGAFLLAYVDPRGGRMSPTAAATFVHNAYIPMGVKNGPAVRRYEGSPGQKGEYIEAEMSIDQKLVAPDLGSLWLSCI
jgi:hypothetical protein